MSNNSNRKMMNLNNMTYRSDNTANERDDGGFGGVDNAGFESWACDQSFNLIDFVGDDTNSSPLEEMPGNNNLNDDEIEKQKEDALYMQYQYSDLMFGDQHHHQHHGLDKRSDELLSLLDNYPDLGMGDYASVPNEYSGTSGHDYHHHGDGLIAQHSGQRASYSRNLDNLDSIPYVPSTSRCSYPVQQVHVKEEPISEYVSAGMRVRLAHLGLQDQSEMRMGGGSGTVPTSRESSVTSSIMSAGQMASTSATTTRLTKPRKYRIKPEAEKLNPVYRIKRQKNNDAVRRSREKAKQLQEAKEQTLHLLQEDNEKKERKIRALEETNARLQRENQLLRQSCRCGGAANAKVVIKR